MKKTKETIGDGLISGWMNQIILFSGKWINIWIIWGGSLMHTSYLNIIRMKIQAIEKV